MSTKLPYVNQPGSMVKILEKIQSAKTPDRFTTDFLTTKLGFKGGNSRQFMPLAKRLGLLATDGSPTALYKKFRNTDSAKAAMAEALRIGYKEVFERNEYAYKLDKEKFKGRVVEITGLEPDNRVVQLICQTWDNLQKLADFEADLPVARSEEEDGEPLPLRSGIEAPKRDHEFPLGLSYVINLVLPKTDDPAVFNAIFKSLRDNLLRN
jgi:hypothetical protein